jgi:hypothetical protein
VDGDDLQKRYDMITSAHKAMVDANTALLTKLEALSGEMDKQPEVESK